MLPKIFDDVAMKGWKDRNSNIDLWIVLELLKIYFDPALEGPMPVEYLFTLQKERIAQIQEEVKEEYTKLLSELREDLDEKPLTEKQVIERLLNIRNTSTLRLKTCAKFCFDQ